MDLLQQENNIKSVNQSQINQIISLHYVQQGNVSTNISAKSYKKTFRSLTLALQIMFILS